MNEWWNVPYMDVNYLSEYNVNFLSRMFFEFFFNIQSRSHMNNNATRGLLSNWVPIWFCLLWAYFMFPLHVALSVGIHTHSSLAQSSHTQPGPHWRMYTEDNGSRPIERRKESTREKSRMRLRPHCTPWKERTSQQSNIVLLQVSANERLFFLHNVASFPIKTCPIFGQPVFMLCLYILSDPVMAWFIAYICSNVYAVEEYTQVCGLSSLSLDGQ